MATFNQDWSSYAVGAIPTDQWNIWDSTLGINSGCKVQLETNWAGSPKALQMSNSLWGATLYTGVQFTNSSLTIRYRGDSDRCNLAWNMKSATLDGATNVSGYIWQFIPSTHISLIGTFWAGGAGQGNIVSTGLYIPPNVHDMNFGMVQNGTSITCTINGTTVHSFTDNSFPNSSGYIGFQNEAGVTYRGLVMVTPSATSMGKNQSSIISEIQ